MIITHCDQDMMDLHETDAPTSSTTKTQNCEFLPVMTLLMIRCYILYVWGSMLVGCCCGLWAWLKIESDGDDF